jgi:hypothetical protein
MGYNTKRYNTKKVVQILQEEFGQLYPLRKISNDKINYFSKKFEIGTQEDRFFTYSLKELNFFRKIYRDLVELKQRGYKVVEEMFLRAKKRTAKGTIYFLAEKYELGERYDLTMGEHWLFDLDKVRKFLKTYDKNAIKHTGRPKKIVIID